jgi:hypothetical protein
MIALNDFPRRSVSPSEGARMQRFAVAVFCLAAARAQNFEVASIKVR